jgi:hypothetical protein
MVDECETGHGERWTGVQSIAGSVRRVKESEGEGRGKREEVFFNAISLLHSDSVNFPSPKPHLPPQELLPSFTSCRNRNATAIATFAASPKHFNAHPRVTTHLPTPQQHSPFSTSIAYPPSATIYPHDQRTARESTVIIVDRMRNTDIRV